MQKILITGANGFLGTILQKQLIENYTIETLGRANNCNVQVNLNADVPTFDADFDLIIHAAGKAHIVPNTKKEMDEFFEVNFSGTKRLCEAFEQRKIFPKAFIFISTVAVYGVDVAEMIDENAERLGSTPYAKSKILAEDFLIEWSRRNDIILSILRLPLVAGQNPPGNLGAMIKGMRTGRYLSIGDADAKKSIVWGADIAKIIPALSKTGGIYNLTDGYHPTFGELELGIAKVLGKKKPAKIPLWAARCLALLGDIIGKRAPINSTKLCKMTSTLTFNDAKARRDLGWAPTSVISMISNII